MNKLYLCREFEMNDWPPCELDFLIRQTQCIVNSYKHWTGKDLWPDALINETDARALFEAPFVLVSAGTENDPVLNYGNRKAMELWEMDWQILTHTPGRYTAEAMEQVQRDHFLETVKNQGYIDNYQGIRISSSGRRFEIQQATVWNLLNDQKQYAGQAATFSRWKYL